MPGYPLTSGERKPQQFVNAIRAQQQGQSNNTGDVTLRTGFASTTVITTLAGTGQRIFLQAQTPTAAIEAISGNLYAPKVATAGQFTIFHSNNATAGRTFSWMIQG